jgi:hypothetical protein
MYTSYLEVKWGQWYICHNCKCEETLLQDNEDNRKHWSWGAYKTRDSLAFSHHEKSTEHLRHYDKYKCQGCDVQCWSNQEYAKHCDSSRHKKINKIVIECKMCEYTTYSKSSMEQHNQTQKHRDKILGVEKDSYICEPCGYSTKFKSQMEQHHLTLKHKAVLNGTCVSQDVYACNTCGYSTEFKHHLDQHNKTQKHKNKIAGIVENVNLYCDKCRYTAGSIALMEQHTKTKKHNK